MEGNHEAFLLPFVEDFLIAPLADPVPEGRRNALFYQLNALACSGGTATNISRTLKGFYNMIKVAVPKALEKAIEAFAEAVETFFMNASVAEPRRPNALTALRQALNLLSQSSWVGDDASIASLPSLTSHASAHEQNDHMKGVGVLFSSIPTPVIIEGLHQVSRRIHRSHSLSYSASFPFVSLDGASRYSSSSAVQEEVVIQGDILQEQKEPSRSAQNKTGVMLTGILLVGAIVLLLVLGFALSKGRRDDEYSERKPLFEQSNSTLTSLKRREDNKYS